MTRIPQKTITPRDVNDLFLGTACTALVLVDLCTDAALSAADALLPLPTLKAPRDARRVRALRREANALDARLCCILTDKDGETLDFIDTVKDALSDIAAHDTQVLRYTTANVLLRLGVPDAVPLAALFTTHILCIITAETMQADLSALPRRTSSRRLNGIIEDFRRRLLLLRPDGLLRAARDIEDVCTRVYHTADGRVMPSPVQEPAVAQAVRILAARLADPQTLHGIIKAKRPEG